MIKKLSNYPLAILIMIVVAYSIYDYFEHITRPGSTFGDHPWYWLAFSVSAVSSLILAVLLVKYIVQKLFKIKNLIIEVMAIGLWMAIYIAFLGPLINSVFWPFDELIFRFSFGPFMIILIGYFIVRVVINLIVRKSILYSN